MCYSLLALDTGTALDWITPHGARVSARGLASPITHACPPRTLFPYLKCASSSLSIYKLIFMKKLSMITLFNWQIVICLKALESLEATSCQRLSPQAIQQQYQNRKFERILPASFVPHIERSRILICNGEKVNLVVTSFVCMTVFSKHYGSVFGETKNGEDFWEQRKR